VLPLTLALAVSSAAASPADPELTLKKPAADARVTLLAAMADELSRNQARLKLGDHPAPYFISYTMKDLDSEQTAARYGALFENGHERNRHLYVDVRVGDYGFDSSLGEELDINFSTKGQSYTAHRDGPLDDDPEALKNALWLVTDEKYKSAVFNFLKKKGETVYTVEDKDKPPSFSREKPAQFVQPLLAATLDHAKWDALVRRVSARFKTAPEVFDSEVRVTRDHETRLFVSSEGSRVLTEQAIYGVHVAAVTRADDGQLLDDSRDFYAPSEGQLPSEAEILQAANKVVDELHALRAAPAIDPYTGPAILEPEASGVLFHEAVGHRLEGDRQDNELEGKTFHGQMGKQLLPSFISIVDDPTAPPVGGMPLNGDYSYDDEGVPAQKVQLVASGVLKSFILSRHPVETFTHSNGHGRAQLSRRPVARMANLIVESSRQVSDEKLKRMLIAEAKRQGKPYGLIIRDITGGNTNTSSYGYQAFKGVPRMVYRVDVKDGKETLVRGVEVVGTPLSAVNKILATGQKPGVFNGYCGAESGMVPVSTVAPATLLQEIELQRVVDGKDRPPVLPGPWAH
jgi:predicted Zn-dependent protease